MKNSKGKGMERLLERGGEGEGMKTFLHRLYMMYHQGRQ